MDQIGNWLPGIAAVLTVIATWQINKRQAKTAEKEGDAKVEQIRADVESALWKRAKDELAEKDKEIEQLKTAYNVLSREHHNLSKEHIQALNRIKRLEDRLDTGHLTPPPHNVPDNTPPIPTRDNWQEPPPIDEAPNE